MPELPEVETTIRGVRPYLLERKIIDVIVRQPRLRFLIPKTIASSLQGQIVKKISRRGKYILFELKDGTLLLHLGMSGRLCILFEPIPPAQKHDHVDIIFNNKTCLRFRDPRRFGAMLWTSEPINDHPLIKSLGIEPLSKKFTGEYLRKKAQGRSIAVKSFVMDSKIIAGVGNIYATESLFAAGIHPLKSANKLTLEDWKTLARHIKLVLRKAIKAGGTTLKDFSSPAGELGYFSVSLKVYGKAGMPCPCCKTKLKSVRISQRSTVFCGKCQR